MFQRIEKYKLQWLVIIGIIIIHFVFAFQKEGYHMDEMISFEMANAEYNPWIVPIQPVGRLAKFVQEEIEADSVGEKFGNIVDTVIDVAKNRGNSKLLSYKADVYEEPVWIAESQFKNYLTTDGTDNFNYLSVYFNVKDDNHPPIHFMLLHTISSIMPGQVYPVMGCMINILMLVGCSVVFIKLGELLDKYEIMKNGLGIRFGTLLALLYGCSQASVATMLLIRMYGVLTFLCVLTFYIHIKKWLGKDFDKKNLGLIIVTVLGFWTQYFFLFYCIALSIVIVIGLIMQKRSREILIYMRAMIIAAMVGVVGFPFAISDVFSSSRGVEALGNLTGGMADYVERLTRYGEILLSRCFGDWRVGLILVLISLGCSVTMFVRQKAHRPLLLICYVPVLVYFLLAAKMAPMFVDRYLMASFPFVIGWLAVVLCALFGHQNTIIKYACLTGVISFCAIQLLTYDGSYLYKGYQEQIRVSEKYQDKACICLYEGSGYYDNLIEFTNYDKTLLVTPKEMLERKETSSIERLQDAIFVVKNIVEEKQVEEILERYGFYIEEVLVEAGAHGDRVYLCKSSK